MAGHLLRSAGAAACLAWALAEDAVVPLDVLAGDDECSLSSEECALQALQLRGAGAAGSEEEPNKVYTDDTGADVLTLSLPEGWTMEDDYPESDDLEDVRDDITMHANYYHKKKLPREVGPGGCQQTPGARECYFYRACRGPRYCVINGYMIVPGFPVAGMENIDGRNAGVFDYLMYEGQKHCGSTSCVLIINPVHHRTQEQMHIHYRTLNYDGHHEQRKLESVLCHSDRGWHKIYSFGQCQEGKARLYDYFPAVFSEVANSFGGMNLAHVGVSVWNTNACGGYKTIVLATTHCSIEHDISRR